MPTNRLKYLYNTVHSQTISSCGEYLFIGNNYGEIFVFSIPQILNGPSDDPVLISASRGHQTKPLQVFQIPERSHVFSLAFHKNFLIVGTVGKVSGYSWTKNEITKKSWEVKILPKKEQDSQMDRAEVNCFWMNKSTEILYAGCGDCNVYGINLEDGQIIREFNGHTDYIHSIDGNGNRLFSASEDGTIKFWDCREKRNVGRLEPYKNENLCRPKFGKWQGTVSITDDWLVCGGGPKASLWHLRSMDCTTDYQFPNSVHVSGFMDDIVYIAGEDNRLYQFTLSGDITAEIPFTGPAIYNVVWQMSPEKFMSISGSSNKLNICTDFNYRDILLDLYKISENGEIN